MQGILGYDTVTVSGAWDHPVLAFPSPPATAPPRHPGSGLCHGWCQGALCVLPLWLAPLGEDSEREFSQQQPRGVPPSLPLFLPMLAPTREASLGPVSIFPTPFSLALAIVIVISS